MEEMYEDLFTINRIKRALCRGNIVFLNFYDKRLDVGGSINKLQPFMFIMLIFGVKYCN